MANFKYSIGNFKIYILIIVYLHQCLVTSSQKQTINHFKSSINESSVLSNSTQNIKAVQDDHIIENRILNGQVATVGQFPYQVVVYADKLICGGAILNKNTIITAAQCIYDPDKNDEIIPENKIIVGAGDVDLNESNMKNFTVKSVHPHEMYKPKGFINDLAIIKINEKFWDESPTQNIQPIKIKNTSTKYKSGMECVLAGWGNKEGKPKYLLYKNFTIYNHMKCKLYFMASMMMRITNEMICAKSKYANTCLGDGGSGLVCTDDVDGNKYLVGITLIVRGLYFPNLPSVYTNVWEYKDWIDNYTMDESEETTTEPTTTPSFSMGLFPVKYYYILSLTFIACIFFN